mmetsp:Transcript_93894/g.242593  ORF Transcript_93894/g.242593 Transcript_93894/m.242593 type:complete len:348 (+) Transcript_93894:1276-2319(+)
MEPTMETSAALAAFSSRDPNPPSSFASASSAARAAFSRSDSHADTTVVRFSLMDWLSVSMCSRNTVMRRPTRSQSLLPFSRPSSASSCAFCRPLSSSSAASRAAFSLRSSSCRSSRDFSARCTAVWLPETSSWRPFSATSASVTCVAAASRAARTTGSSSEALFSTFSASTAAACESAAAACAAFSASLAASSSLAGALSPSEECCMVRAASSGAAVSACTSSWLRLACTERSQLSASRAAACDATSSAAAAVSSAVACALRATVKSLNASFSALTEALYIDSFLVRSCSPRSFVSFACRSVVVLLFSTSRAAWSSPRRSARFVAVLFQVSRCACRRPCEMRRDTLL